MKTIDEINKEVEARLLSGKTSPCPKCRGTRIWYQGLGAAEWHCEQCAKGYTSSYDPLVGFSIVYSQYNAQLDEVTKYFIGYTFKLGNTTHEITKAYDPFSGKMQTKTKNYTWEFYRGPTSWQYRKV